MFESMLAKYRDEVRKSVDKLQTFLENGTHTANDTNNERITVLVSDKSLQR